MKTEQKDFRKISFVEHKTLKSSLTMDNREKKLLNEKQ